MNKIFNVACKCIVCVRSSKYCDCDSSFFGACLKIYFLFITIILDWFHFSNINFFLFIFFQNNNAVFYLVGHITNAFLLRSESILISDCNNYGSFLFVCKLKVKSTRCSILCLELLQTQFREECLVYSNNRQFFH